MGRIIENVPFGEPTREEEQKADTVLINIHHFYKDSADAARLHLFHLEGVDKLEGSEYIAQHLRATRANAKVLTEYLKTIYGGGS